MQLVRYHMEHDSIIGCDLELSGNEQINDQICFNLKEAGVQEIRHNPTWFERETSAHHCIPPETEPSITHPLIAVSISVSH